jgi:predicted glycosyltransferase
MTSTRVLYISGSIGLGHARRDLAIARELRRLDPGVEIAWLAGEPNFQHKRSRKSFCVSRTLELTWIWYELPDHTPRAC